MPHIDAKIIAGILTSFILGGLMYFLGKDTVEALIVSMLGSIFTILFSIKIDIHNSSILTLDSIRICKEIHSNPKLKELIPEIIKSHQEIEKFHNEYLLDESIESLRKCSAILSNLAKQRIDTKTEDIRIKILLKILNNTKKQVLSTTYPSRWLENLGSRAFEENKKVIKNGVKIKRIFIVDDITDDVIELITSHLSIGVQCSIAFEDKIPKEIKKHQIIYDDIAVTTPAYEKYGSMDGGVISFDEKDIYQAKNTWDRLELFSAKISNKEDLESFKKT